MKVFQMMGRKKRWLLAGAMIVLLAAASGGIYLTQVIQYQNAVKNLTFAEINIEKIADGTYIGECDVDFVYAKVAVTMENGEISGIQLLEHENERGTPAESTIEDMVKEQTTNVDAVSGATNSSRVLRKAVENALTEQKTL